MYFKQDKEFGCQQRYLKEQAGVSFRFHVIPGMLLIVSLFLCGISLPRKRFSPAPGGEQARSQSAGGLQGMG